MALENPDQVNLEQAIHTMKEAREIRLPAYNIQEISTGFG